MLEANKKYFSDATSSFTVSPVDTTQYKLSRKHAYVALANISDALNRMLAEPRTKQRNAPELNQIVVLNYMMATHTATLAAIGRDKGPLPVEMDYTPVIRVVISNLTRGGEILKSAKTSISTNTKPDTQKKVESQSETLFSMFEGGSLTTEPGVGEVSALKKLNTTREGNAIEEVTGPIMESDSETPGEIRQVNEQVALLVAKRKSELEQGIRESETGRRITQIKSVNDQFNFIWKISEDLLKIIAKVNIFFFLYCIQISNP